jgi:hypothetical protein
VAEDVNLEVGPKFVESDYKLMVVFVDAALGGQSLGNIFVNEVLDVLPDVLIDLYFFFGGGFGLLCEVIDESEWMKGYPRS